jgi:hypothetical protein
MHACAGVLYENYTQQCYWWEFYSIMRRVLLIGLTVSLYRDRPSRYAALSFANLVILAAHIKYAVFRAVRDVLCSAASLALL